MNGKLKTLGLLFVCLNLQGCAWLCNNFGWFCEAEDKKAETPVVTYTPVEQAALTLGFESTTACEIDRESLYPRNDENENGIVDALECQLLIDSGDVENLSPIQSQLDALAAVNDFMLEPATEFQDLVDRVKDAEALYSPAEIKAAIQQYYVVDDVLESYAEKADALAQTYSTEAVAECSRVEGERNLLLVDALQHPSAIEQSAEALNAQVLSQSAFLPVPVPVHPVQARAFAEAVQRLQGMNVDVDPTSNVIALVTALSESMPVIQQTALANLVNTDLLNGDAIALIAMGNTVSVAQYIQEQIDPEYAQSVAVMAMGNNNNAFTKVNAPGDNWLDALAGGFETMTPPQHDIWVNYLAASDVKAEVYLAYGSATTGLVSFVKEPVYSLLKLTYPANEGGTFELEFWQDDEKLSLSEVSSGVTEDGEIILSCKAAALEGLDVRVTYVSADNLPLPPSAVPTFYFNGNELVLTDFANSTPSTINLGSWSLGSDGVDFELPEQPELTAMMLLEYAFGLDRGACQNPTEDSVKAICFLAATVFNPSDYVDEADPFAAFAADMQPLLDAYALKDEVERVAYLKTNYPTLADELNVDGPSKLAYYLKLLALADWYIGDDYVGYAVRQGSNTVEIDLLTQTCSVDPGVTLLNINDALIGRQEALIGTGEVSKRIPSDANVQIIDYYVPQFPTFSDDADENMRRLRWLTGLAPDERDIKPEIGVAEDGSDPLDVGALADIRYLLETYSEASVNKLVSDIQTLLANGRGVAINANGASAALADAALNIVSQSYPQWSDHVKIMSSGAYKNYMFVMPEIVREDDLIVNAFNGGSPLYDQELATNRRGLHNHDAINNYWSMASSLGLDIDLAHARTFGTLPVGANLGDRIASIKLSNVTAGDDFTITGDLLSYATQNGEYYDFGCDALGLLDEDAGLAVNYVATENDSALTADRVPALTLYLGDREGSSVTIESVDLGGFYNQEPPQSQEVGPVNFTVNADDEVEAQTSFDQVPAIPTLATIVAESLMDPTVDCDLPVTYSVDAGNSLEAVSDIPNAWRCKLRMSVYENEALPTPEQINSNQDVVNLEASALAYLRYTKDLTAVVEDHEQRQQIVTDFILSRVSGVSSLDQLTMAHQEQIHVERCSVENELFKFDGYFKQMISVGQKNNLVQYVANKKDANIRPNSVVGYHLIHIGGNRSFVDMDFVLAKTKMEQMLQTYAPSHLTDEMAVFYVNNLGLEAPFGLTAVKWNELASYEGADVLWSTMAEVYQWERGCRSDVPSMASGVSQLSNVLRDAWATDGRVNLFFGPLVNDTDVSLHSIVYVRGSNLNSMADEGITYASTGMEFNRIGFVGLNSIFAQEYRDFGGLYITYGRGFTLSTSSYMNDVIGVNGCINQGQAFTPGNRIQSCPVVGGLQANQYDKSSGNMILSYLSQPDIINAVIAEFDVGADDDGGPWRLKPENL